MPGGTRRRCTRRPRRTGYRSRRSGPDRIVDPRSWWSPRRYRRSAERRSSRRTCRPRTAGRPHRHGRSCHSCRGRCADPRTAPWPRRRRPRAERRTMQRTGPTNRPRRRRRQSHTRRSARHRSPAAHRRRHTRRRRDRCSGLPAMTRPNCRRPATTTTRRPPAWSMTISAGNSRAFSVLGGGAWASRRPRLPALLDGISPRSPTGQPPRPQTELRRADRRCSGVPVLSSTQRSPRLCRA